MRKFTQIIESAKTSDVQPGNALLRTGVTNHYTPIENILTNINNLFCTRLGVVAGIGEDNVSIKLHSMKFVNDESINDILYNPLDRFTSLASYICQQGLTKITKVYLGMYYVVYFSPEDIANAQNPEVMVQKSQCPCPGECCESLYNEFEYSTIIKEDDSEEEMKSETVEKVLELLDGPDKVKAAKQLELLVSNEISLPREYYFSAIKFKTGEEAIALRWKYTKKMPFGKAEGDGEYKEISVENTRSLMHIFGKGEKAIWVQDFAEDSLVKLPEEVEKLIKSILELLEADETDDPSVYSLTGERKERKDKDEDKEDKEDKDEDKEDNTDKSSDDNDDEDDNSRGEDDDNLNN